MSVRATIFIGRFMRSSSNGTNTRVLFDQAFRIFFRKRGYIEKMIASMLPETHAGAPKAPPPGAQRIQEALFSGLNER